MNAPYCKAEAFPLRTWIVEEKDEDEFEVITYVGIGAEELELQYDVAYDMDEAKEMAEKQFLTFFPVLELVFNLGRDSK